MMVWFLSRNKDLELWEEAEIIRHLGIFLRTGGFVKLPSNA